MFHNDVIAVGNRNLLFCHSEAFADQASVFQDLNKACKAHPLHIVEVSGQQVSVEQAVNSYLFNSQLLSLKDGSTLIIVPSECQKEPAVWTCLQNLVADNRCPISKLKVFDLRQSMHNGGGPACLRLRVVLSDQELAATNQHCLVNGTQLAILRTWVNKHYRDRLAPEDLADPALLNESRTALDELTGILQLGSVYQFQR